jgi:serine/threonine protein kinase/tetratricopeptide (TPR) repeat protein
MAIKCPSCNADNAETQRFCGDCGTQLPTPQGHPPVLTETLQMPVRELTTGSTFAGRYQVIEELGHGGMGRVYKVLDMDIKEKIALKLLRPEIALDKETIERFSNELKLARKIRHKNICGMFDLGKAEGTTFITMEFVPGQDLKRLIRQTGQLGAGRAVSIAKQVSEGLAEAHHLGVIHRDLKPQNIMVDEDGNARIMDFGIARSLSGKSITGAGVMIGTPEYMSPEQVEGKEIDQRSDIYSLGVILFEMVTGRVPFEGDTPLTIAVKHKSERPPNPRELNAQIPEELSRVLLRCLEKDKAKRYQTAENLHADLVTVEAGLPTTERVVAKRRSMTSREITVKFTVRKLLVPPFGIIVLAVVAFMVWRLRPPKPPIVPSSAKPTVAVLYFKNTSADPALDSWKENLPALLAAGLSQSRYLRVVDDPTLYGILKKRNLLGSEKYTAEELKNIAAEGGATHLLSGNYFTAGGKFIVNLSLIDAKTGSVLKPIQEEAANKDAIYATVDTLVKKIKAAMNIPEQLIDESIYKMVGEVYTKNPQALQNYIEAVRLDQNYDYDNVIKVCEKAIDIDPEFAMAYVMLSKAYGNQGDYFKRYQYLTKAYQLKDKLPERDRLVVEGSLYAAKERTIPKAVDILKRAVERYPDDFQARYLLAYLLNWVDRDLQIKEWENLIYGQNQTKSRKAWGFLVGNYCDKGDYARARESYEAMVKANPPVGAWDHVSLGCLYMLEKNFEAALPEFEKAVAAAPDDAGIRTELAVYHTLKDDVKKSRGILDGLRRVSQDPSSLDGDFISLDLVEGKLRDVLHLVEESEKKDKAAESLPLWMNGVFQWRGNLYLQTGRPSRALDEFRKALEVIKKEEARIQDVGFSNLAHSRRTCMIWQVCALCDSGNISEAEALYREFERLVPDHQKKFREQKCLCYNSEIVEGKIALAKKDYPEAIRKLESGWQQMVREDTNASDHAYFLDILADAYQLGGRLDRAAETYGRIQELLSGRWNWGAVYTRSYYRLGKVYEQLGKKAEAGESYRKFLNLWKDADPGLPEVPDAKARLATLKGS